MKIYFRMKSIPEIRGLSSKERGWLYRRYAGRAMLTWRGVLAYVAYVFLYFAAFLIYSEIVQTGLGPGERLVVLVLLLGLAVGILQVSRLNLARKDICREVAFWQSRGVLPEGPESEYQASEGGEAQEGSGSPL